VPLWKLWEVIEMALAWILHHYWLLPELVEQMSC
jgi:hypothetical protein